MQFSGVFKIFDFEFSCSSDFLEKLLMGLYDDDEEEEIHAASVSLKVCGY